MKCGGGLGHKCTNGRKLIPFFFLKERERERGREKEREISIIARIYILEKMFDVEEELIMPRSGEAKKWCGTCRLMSEARWLLLPWAKKSRRVGSVPQTTGLEVRSAC